MLEEFHPTIVHVAGKDNNAADALSRLDMEGHNYDELQWEASNPPLAYQDELQEMILMLFPLASKNKLEPNNKFPF